MGQHLSSLHRAVQATPPTVAADAPHDILHRLLRALDVLRWKDGEVSEEKTKAVQEGEEEWGDGKTGR